MVICGGSASGRRYFHPDEDNTVRASGKGLRFDIYL